MSLTKKCCCGKKCSVVSHHWLTDHQDHLEQSLHINVIWSVRRTCLGCIHVLWTFFTFLSNCSQWHFLKWSLKSRRGVFQSIFLDCFFFSFFLPSVNLNSVESLSMHLYTLYMCVVIVVKSVLWIYSQNYVATGTWTFFQKGCQNSLMFRRFLHH